jgi:hypothetical protein
MDLSKMLTRRSLILYFGDLVEIVCRRGPLQDCLSGSTKTENHCVPLNNEICQDLKDAGHAAQTHPKATFNLQGDKWISFTRATEADGSHRQSEIGGNAKAKCSNFCMGEVEFLADVNEVKGLKFCWQLIVRKRSGEKVSSDYMQQIAKGVGIVGNPLHMSITLREAKHSLKAADEQYRQLKLKAPMMQQDFLQERMRDNTLMEKTRSHAKQCLKQEQSRDNT